MRGILSHRLRVQPVDGGADLGGAKELTRAQTEEVEVFLLAGEHIARWFYPCPPGLHRGLDRFYVEDPRFTANIDKRGPGLAAYAARAFAANADRCEAGGANSPGGSAA